MVSIHTVSILTYGLLTASNAFRVYNISEDALQNESDYYPGGYGGGGYGGGGYGGGGYGGGGWSCNNYNFQQYQTYRTSFTSRSTTSHTPYGSFQSYFISKSSHYTNAIVPYGNRGCNGGWNHYGGYCFSPAAYKCYQDQIYYALNYIWQQKIALTQADFSSYSWIHNCLSICPRCRRFGGYGWYNSWYNRAIGQSWYNQWQCPTFRDYFGRINGGGHFMNYQQYFINNLQGYGTSYISPYNSGCSNGYGHYGSYCFSPPAYRCFQQQTLYALQYAYKYRSSYSSSYVSQYFSWAYSAVRHSGINSWCGVMNIGFHNCRNQISHFRNWYSFTTHTSHTYHNSYGLR